VDPEFIICDESVSALDVSVQAQVLNLLTELKQEYGFTYIFISHDLSVVKYMADRIMVMKDGAIEEIGEADDTQKLIEAIPKGRLSDIEEAVAKRSQPSDAGQPSTSPD
jgi:peptide/nickel transport system ATP-binding protein